MPDTLVDQVCAQFRAVASRVRVGGDVELDVLREVVAGVFPDIIWTYAEAAATEDRYVGTLPQADGMTVTVRREVTTAPAMQLALSVEAAADRRWLHVYKRFAAQPAAAESGARTVYAPGAVVVAEQKTIAARSLMVTWPDQRTEQAVVTPASRWADVHAFVQLFVTAAAEGGAISDSNHLAYVKDPRTFLARHMAAPSNECRSNGPGCIEIYENHGASLLMAAHQLGLPLDAVMNVGGEVVPVRAIFEGYRYAVIPSLDPTLGRFPQIAHGPRRDMFDQAIPGMWHTADTYQFFAAAMAYVPFAEWGARWRTFDDRMVSLDDLMRSTIAVYLHAWNGTEVTDHSVLHPDILVRYLIRRGEDPAPLQRMFLARELSFDLAQRAPSEVAHYAQTVAELVANPALTWSDAERAQIRQWLDAVRTWVFTQGLGHGGAVYEVTHLWRGLDVLVTTHPEWLP